MKISRNWLNNYIKSDKSDTELVDAFTQLGLECTYEKSNSIDSNIVVGEVVSCVKHPNADRLKVCEVDILTGELLTIVCGASNVIENILVPVAKIGSKVGEFKIKKTKIRGVTSHGMICSEKELGLSDNHEGIMILDNQFKKGYQLRKLLSVEEDTVFDFDITPNRGDCLSHIGIARELSIIEKSKSKIISHKQKNPKVKENSETLTISIDNDNCKRYAACIIRNVNVEDSPDWLKRSLKSIGQKSINNIVDAANFILMDLGHPMHTFDLDKIKSNQIKVRSAKKNETIITLDACKRKLNSNNLLICDGNNPIAIAGVIGSNNSEVDKNTKHILIESAYFDPINIRKSSKSLGISTEASRRFERDTDINMVIPALNKLALLIQNIAGGEISSGFFDIYDRKFDRFDSKGLLLPHALRKVPFDINKCNNFLGTNISFKVVCKIFDSLCIDYTNQGKKLICTIPSFRNDISEECDLYEEVARVFGYNNIPENKFFKGSYESFFSNLEINQNKYRQYFSTNGFNEHYSNSLVNIKDTKLFSDSEPIELSNPLNQEMQFLRNNLLPGLLKAVSFNMRRNLNHFKLFEIGNIHFKQKSEFNEETHLAICWIDSKKRHWRSYSTIDFYSIKSEIIQFFKFFGLDNIVFSNTNNRLGLASSFDVKVDNFNIGYFGIIKSEIIQYYQIKSNVFIFNINLEFINNIVGNLKTKFLQFSQFPSIKRDISFELDNKSDIALIIDTIKSSNSKVIKDVYIFDLYDLDKDMNKKSIGISIEFQSLTETLTDEAVDKIYSKILMKLKNNFNIKQR